MKLDIDDFKYNLDIFRKMNNLMINHEKYKRMILKVIIKNQNMTFENANLGDTRKKRIVEMLNNMCTYIKSKNKILPDTVIYFNICDAYAYDYQDLPLFTIAKPKNKKGILFPDDTFICHKMETECDNWDKIKKTVIHNCDLEKDKINIIYFKGANTGSDKHNLRYLLSQENNLPIKINLTDKYKPMYSFCKYKYLLNLPGHQPWSYRFKYLFLMNSLIIDVAIKQHYTTTEHNERWINFFDSIFVPNEDYIELEYDWYEKKDNKDEYRKLVTNIKKTYEYYENNPEEYYKITKSGYNKVQMISNQFVLEMLYDLIVRYSNKLTDFIDQL